MNDNKKPLEEWTVRDIVMECRRRADTEGCGDCPARDTVCDDSRMPREYPVPDDPEFCSAHSVPDTGTTIDLPGPPSAGQSDASATGDKPRLCEVLGVEVGEEFQIRRPSNTTPKLYINHAGNVALVGDPKLAMGAGLYATIIYAINYPEAIVRLPQWDADELALMRYLRKLGAVYITRDKDGCLCAWRQKPEWKGGRIWDNDKEALAIEMQLPPEGLLPHLRPGECVALEEVAGT